MFFDDFPAVGRTLFYHPDSLQSTTRTAHDLTRRLSHSVTTSFMTAYCHLHRTYEQMCVFTGKWSVSMN